MRQNSVAPGVLHTRKFTLPAFSPDTFFTYHWPSPPPLKFPAISDTHRTWKNKRDQFEAETDQDNGADDWLDFAGDPVGYESIERFLFCIAGTFLARAKRAFRAGRSWPHFEKTEREIEPNAEVKLIENPAKKALWMGETLDNELRLAIFDVIAHRLCTEIWLQDYPTPAQKCEGKVSHGGQRSTPGKIREVGRIESAPSFDDNGHVRPQSPCWMTDRPGLMQPLYADETRLPSGIADAVQEAMAVVQNGGCAVDAELEQTFRMPTWNDEL